MLATDHTSDYLLKQTRSTFLWTRIFNIPFWSILSMLTLILYKEMQINALQIAIFIAIKPLSALCAPYWSASLHHRQDRLVSNLVWANVIRYLPFLFFPWIDSSWLMIFAFGIYMMMNRGVMPAWMELFKRNIKGGARERVFAYGSSLDYLGPALLPLAVGYFLDDYHLEWRWLFFGGAIIGLISTVFLFRLPAIQLSGNIPVELSSGRIILDEILKPWKQSWTLIKERPDFGKYQVGFLLGGSGLMVMHATLPMFFVDVLRLSYTEMALAIALCKGIGFVAASPLWIKLFRRVDIYTFSIWPPFLCILFPLLLIGAQYQSLLIYFAYLVYGFMQAGSELSWHMSGPIFSKEKDSSIYSQTNVLTIGMRGCVAPFLGSLLYTFTNSTAVMLCGAFLCFLATERLISYSRSIKVAPQTTE